MNNYLEEIRKKSNNNMGKNGRNSNNGVFHVHDKKGKMETGHVIGNPNFKRYNIGDRDYICT